MADFFLLLLCSFLWPCLTVSIALGSLNTSNSIRDGDTLVSPGGVFELGFFTPGSSSRREVPLNDTSGVVEVTDQGILVLLDGNRSIVWSSNASRPVRSPVVQLLDSGNLVVKDELDRNPGNFIWQSFDYSGNTFLAGMKIGRDFRAGLDRYLSSWKAPDDPSLHARFRTEQLERMGSNTGDRMLCEENRVKLYRSYRRLWIYTDQNGIRRNRTRSNANRTIIAATSSAGVLISGLTLVIFLRRHKNRKNGWLTPPSDGSASDYQNHKEDLELPIFDLTDITRATNNFLTKNILGEGGFGKAACECCILGKMKSSVNVCRKHGLSII
ncbi:hypothetical protein V6N13_009746 [Hibiscus sabdariffa]